MASSTDSIGHYTKTVWDNAYILSITAGKDRFDATTSEEKVPKYYENLEKLDVSQLKIGVPKEYFGDGIDDIVKEKTYQALKVLEKQGAKLVEVSVPHTKYGIVIYYIIQPAEVASNLARYDGVRYGKPRTYFADEAKRRIMIGTYSTASESFNDTYVKAAKVRTLLINEFNNAFKKVDVMIMPVASTPPFKFNEATDDPLKMYMMDVLTVTVNMTGHPGLAIPAGFTDDNRPIGIQIVGPHFSEQLLYQVAYAYERETKWYKVKPDMSWL